MPKNKQTTLASNKAKIGQLADEIALLSSAPLTVEEYGRIQTLRDKLDYLLVNLEIEGQEAKIKNMTKVLDIMKEAKLRESL